MQAPPKCCVAPIRLRAAWVLSLSLGFALGARAEQPSLEEVVTVPEPVVVEEVPVVVEEEPWDAGGIVVGDIILQPTVTQDAGPESDVAALTDRPFPEDSGACAAAPGGHGSTGAAWFLSWLLAVFWARRQMSRRSQSPT